MPLLSLATVVPTALFVLPDYGKATSKVHCNFNVKVVSNNIVQFYWSENYDTENHKLWCSVGPFIKVAMIEESFFSAVVQLNAETVTVPFVHSHMNQLCFHLTIGMIIETF